MAVLQQGDQAAQGQACIHLGTHLGRERAGGAVGLQAGDLGGGPGLEAEAPVPDRVSRGAHRLVGGRALGEGHRLGQVVAGLGQGDPAGGAEGGQGGAGVGVLLGQGHGAALRRNGQPAAGEGVEPAR